VILIQSHACIVFDCCNPSVELSVVSFLGIRHSHDITTAETDSVISPSLQIKLRGLLLVAGSGKRGRPSYKL
jgi:hypothetical protein